MPAFFIITIIMEITIKREASTEIIYLGNNTWVQIDNCGTNCTKAFYTKKENFIYGAEVYLPANPSEELEQEVEKILSSFDIKPQAVLDIE